MNNKIYYAAVALATIPNSVFAQQTQTTTEKPIKLVFVMKRQLNGICF